MEKFKIDNPNPAIIDLLVNILANQHTFIDLALKEFAAKDGRDHAELGAKFDKDCAAYREHLWDYLLENFGRLEVNDLIE